jgi:hypothetical protein
MDAPGVVVVPGVVSEAKASEYVSRAHDWLESFDLGYRRTEPSTWKQANLRQSLPCSLRQPPSLAHVD